MPNSPQQKIVRKQHFCPCELVAGGVDDNLNSAGHVPKNIKLVNNRPHPNIVSAADCSPLIIMNIPIAFGVVVFSVLSRNVVRLIGAFLHRNGKNVLVDSDSAVVFIATENELAVEPDFPGILATKTELYFLLFL